MASVACSMSLALLSCRTVSTDVAVASPVDTCAGAVASVDAVDPPGAAGAHHTTAVGEFANALLCIAVPVGTDSTCWGVTEASSEEGSGATVATVATGSAAASVCHHTTAAMAPQPKIRSRRNVDGVNLYKTLKQLSRSLPTTFVFVFFCGWVEHKQQHNPSCMQAHTESNSSGVQQQEQ